MTYLATALSWLLTLSILILAVVNGMSLKTYRQQGTSLKQTLSRWLASPPAWILGILAALRLGVALWARPQTNLGRASLLLGTIVLALGAAGFLFSERPSDQ